MKKLLLPFAVFMSLTACGDNPSSPKNDISSNSIVDNNKGYKVSYYHKYTNNQLTAIGACFYHLGKFTWKETSPKMNYGYKIEGDSLWLGPIPSEYDSDDYNRNKENLSISTNHDGLFGTWETTGCERNIATKEIECYPYLMGITQTLYITKDSITEVFKLDSNTLSDKNKEINVNQFIRYFNYDMDEIRIDSLIEAKIIEVIDHNSIKLNTQLFTISDASRFDSTGMNYIVIFSSNGKSCTLHDTRGVISKEQCLEGNEKLLLSSRDPHDIESFYEDGFIDIFGYDNETEFHKCAYDLLAQETIDFLNENAYYEGNE